ncbi:MAG TPA: hypothetical protein VEV41_24685 [Terriglobales bacterium]|nr:hypothetical protein [Terriglobales bacterium]
MKRFRLVLLLVLSVGITLTSASFPRTKGLRKTAHSAKACSTSLGSCPPEGCGGGDKLLNKKKNRLDIPQDSYQVMTFEDFLHLEEERPAQWTENQARGDVEAMGEDTPVVLAGYMIGAHPGSPETCNCKLSGEPNNDYHINMVERPSDRLWNSIVVEMTPRIRASVPQWTLEKLDSLITDANNPPLVRVSGYLLFDSEHVSRSGGARVTIWEIHPVTKFEVCNGAQCTVDSDNGWQDITHGSQ